MEGNQMKMRESLENIAGYAETARCHTNDVHILSFLGEIEMWARSALSAPPRQCDVGTPDEQSERYHAFCQKCKMPHFAESAYCAHECVCMDAADCKFAWAQTPYEAEEGAGE